MLERLDGGRAALVVRVVDVEDARVAARTVVAHAGDTPVAWRGTAEALAAVRAESPSADVWLAWESLGAPSPADLASLAPTTLDVDLAFVTADTVVAAHTLGLRVAVHGVHDAEPACWAAALGPTCWSRTTRVRCRRRSTGHASLPQPSVTRPRPRWVRGRRAWHTASPTR